MGPKIGRAKFDQRMWRLTARKDAIAQDQHYASGERQITAGVRIQLHCCLPRNQSEKRAVSDQMIQRPGGNEITGNTQTEKDEDADT